MTTVLTTSDLEEHDLDTTLIVEAAAGTGKTTALVGRIVRIIAEGKAEVGEIVAVTFTEKAAGELKLRLRERLDGARVAAGHNQAERARLDRALRQLEEAHVDTIHTFCAALLRERPVEASVDPLFEVLTEPASKRLFDEAFGRWLQDELAEPPQGVRRALRRSAFGGEDGPVDRLRKAAWDLAQWRDFTTAWTRDPFDREKEIVSLVSLLHEVAELTRNPASTNDPLFYGTGPIRRLSDEIELQQTFGDQGTNDYDGWEAGLVDLSRDRTLTRVKQGRGASYRDGIPRARVLAGLTDLRARLDNFRMSADADLAALLQRELRGALQMYEHMKARDGALDFVDLLLVARNLVRDNREVRESFQRRFKRIFVDEFQDTDPLQAEILVLLAADDPNETDWRRARPLPGHLFLVGDPKQSIYRFRGADVAIYREVCRRAPEWGATLVHLTTSFRSVPEIQSFVNAAFTSVMTGDDFTLQASYVPLTRHRPPLDGQPCIVALPVPEPYPAHTSRYHTDRAIEQSLPGAIAAFVDWIVNQSNWNVTERTGDATVKVSSKHICVLFRRFVSWESDVTRPYVEALEARGIPHVLVGGRAFHEREEVEALRAALTAIEWPDDELSVFATLRGPFFAIGDEELLEWAHHFGRRKDDRFSRGIFHPFRVPQVFTENTPAEIAHLRPIAEALWLLQRLHRHRNYVQKDDSAQGTGFTERTSGGVSGTLQELLAATRAHVGFALRTGGEQALANVLHIAELARQYEMGGGISFRGFVEELRVAADTAQASEAPILEEDSDGVRMMTVHKAKGLEFPIVILADLTCKLSRPDAGRWINAASSMCALKLGGWAPTDLILHGPEEAARDKAEGDRLAYVAATRARDVLVVPTIGDEVYEGGWLDPLMPAVYPSPIGRQTNAPGAGCPSFPSKDSVLTRPDGDPARPMTVAPGSYRFGPSPSPEPRAPNPESYSVVWWDPHVLALDADSGYGLRRDDLISKDGDPAKVAARLALYEQWRTGRDEAAARARVPSLRVRTATSVALDRAFDPTLEDGPAAPEIEVIDFSRSAERPFGPRFGSLVHATLATVPLDASERVIKAVAHAQGRILPPAGHERYTEEEEYAAVEVVSSLLKDPLFDRVRQAERAGRCDRELPIVWKAPDGTLIEGTIDLAFEELTGLTVVDFKTDRELATDLERYRRQLTVYCQALGTLRNTTARGILARI
jgi:ATP-dependent exoDNAse (exonuclease V) beta subunit